MPINGEPGKCYAKCLMPNTYEPTQEIYILYTGIDKENNPSIEKDTQQSKEFVLRAFTVNKIVKLGKYGGTYAHRDIAFEFGSAISPVFKLYLIKEYQRQER